MRQGFIGTVMIGTVLLSLVVSTSVAAEVPPPPSHSEWTWAPLEKFGRGVGNVLFGWLEIPATTYERWDERDTISSFFGGVAIGVVRGVARTAVGAFEIVTFPLPVPDGYAPILPPLAYGNRFHGGGWKEPPGR